MNAPDGGALRRLRARLAHLKVVAGYAVRPFHATSQLLGLRKELERYVQYWPPGHFYSPIPSTDDVRRREAEVFAFPREIAGVDLNEPGQLAMIRALAEHYPSNPYVGGTRAVRYTADNPNFAPAEAITLYCMILHRRPKRIIEVGCGYSSLVILDALDELGDPDVEVTMIEPHAELLRSLLRPGDERRVAILERPLQEVGTDVFAGLRDGDILFIDSTHVCKTDSDVTHALGRVLPSLAAGVSVHFHDIFWPFEYPREWVYQGRAWNEAYALRAFLQYNTAFRIELFLSYLWYVHEDALTAAMPLVAANGSSLWLRRV